MPVGPTIRIMYTHTPCTAQHTQHNIQLLFYIRSWERSFETKCNYWTHWNLKHQQHKIELIKKIRLSCSVSSVFRHFVLSIFLSRFFVLLPKDENVFNFMIGHEWAFSDPFCCGGWSTKHLTIINVIYYEFICFQTNWMQQ